MNKDIVIIYDGLCGFCNQSVLFILKREREGITSFSANTSAYSKGQFEKYGLADISRETLILIENGVAYTFSDAVLQISKYLVFPWSLFYGFRILPKNLRDAVYRIIARNRYRFFGKNDSCEIPGEDVRKRFIED